VGKTNRVIPGSIVALAIATRVAAVLVLQSHHVPRSTYEHGEIAANMLAGRGFATHFLGADGPTSQQAPIYPTLVCIAYAIAGIETPNSLLIIELGQTVLAGVLVIGAMRLARAIDPTRAWLEWTSGLVTALHPTLVYAATHVQVALLGATLLVWTLAFGYECAASHRLRHAAFCGFLLALLALTDPILALAALGVACAIFAAGPPALDPIRSLRLLAVVATTALAGVSPWLVRNYLVHGEFVAIKSTFGYAFWQGNCSRSEGTDKVVRDSVERLLRGETAPTDLAGLNRRLWEARHEAGYIDDIALSKHDYSVLASVSEPERSRILFQRALADLKAVPGRYSRLCVRRLRYFIFFDETNPKSRVMAYRLPHLGLTLLAGAGLLLAGSSLRRRLLPTIIPVAVVVIFHSLTIVSARFHVPLEPLLGIWGACALVRGADSLGAMLKGSRQSASVRDHVESIGIKGRLAVSHRSQRLGVLSRGALDVSEDQAASHAENTDQTGTSPRYSKDGHFVAECGGLV
jgi:hypothetical protein